MSEREGEWERERERERGREGGLEDKISNNDNASEDDSKDRLSVEHKLIQMHLFHLFPAPMRRSSSLNKFETLHSPH